MAILNHTSRSTEHAVPWVRTMPALGWVLVLGLAARLLLWSVWFDAPVRIVDAKDYDRLATALVTRGAYVDAQGNLTSLRPPGYPAFLAAIYSVCGVGNHSAVRLAQSFLSLVTVVFVYRIGRELFSDMAASWASVITCFYPTLLGFGNLLLSETLFTLVVVLLTWSTVIALRRDSLGYLVLTGVLLGVGAYVRSILWLFAPVLSFYLCIAWPRPGFRRITSAIIPFVICLVLLTPWSIRNTRLHRTFTMVDVMGGRNAMMGNYEHTPLERNWATINVVAGDKQWFRVLERETPGYSELTQGQIDKLALRHGIRFALSHPFLTIQRDVVRFFNFWQLERTIAAGIRKGTFGHIPSWTALPVAAILAVYYAATLFAGLFGLAFSDRIECKSYWFLALTIAFPCVIHTLIFAHSRYHLPVIPILALFAGHAIVTRRSIWNHRHTFRFGIAVSLCFLFVLGWAREAILVDLPRL